MGTASAPTPAQRPAEGEVSSIRRNEVYQEASLNTTKQPVWVLTGLYKLSLGRGHKESSMCFPSR